MPRAPAPKPTGRDPRALGSGPRIPAGGSYPAAIGPQPVEINRGQRAFCLRRRALDGGLRFPVRGPSISGQLARIVRRGARASDHAPVVRRP